MNGITRGIKITILIVGLLSSISGGCQDVPSYRGLKKINPALYIGEVSEQHRPLEIVLSQNNNQKWKAFAVDRKIRDEIYEGNYSFINRAIIYYRLIYILIKYPQLKKEETYYKNVWKIDKKYDHKYIVLIYEQQIIFMILVLISGISFIFLTLYSVFKK